MEAIPWHAKEKEWVLKKLETNAESGLTDSEVIKRQEFYGKNSLRDKPLTPFYLIFLRQFASPLIYLLLMASLAAFLMGESKDALVILTVIVLNAIIGSLQEGKAEKSLAALRKITLVLSKVLRNKEEKSISSVHLVPGDIIFFQAGDAIGGDCRLIEAFSLEISESALTGESLPVTKIPSVLPEDTSLTDRSNMLYAGTFVSSGRAKGIVVKIGEETEIGKIAIMAESTPHSPTPLEKRISDFSRILVIFAVILFAFIVSIGLWRNISLLEIVMVAITQVVSMVPEGLPVAMTVALSVGVQRMASKRTIVRKLSAVETLGSTTVICTDKTGTLTKNEMTAINIILANGEKFTVTGAGYGPEGDIQKDGKPILPLKGDDLYDLLKISLLCNDGNVYREGDNWKTIGDPTEAALIVLGKKAKIFKDQLDREYPRTGEIPFNSLEKIMITEHRDKQGKKFLAIKGALEVVLPLCLNYSERGIEKKIEHYAEIELWANQMASKALRVLGFAYFTESYLKPLKDFQQKGTFLGLIGQMDPPRNEVSQAIRDCISAGIKPVMITGDHKITGREIAKAIGLSQEGDLAIDGTEFANFSPQEIKEKIKHVSVFARVQPSQKLKIVELLQKDHHVVAMTGDGVNDAPALMKADVGVAMGITGTEVAKEASKIIITDDNFSTIVSAVAEGRLVYQNIKKVILLFFATSLSEIIVLLLALILGFPLPFTAVQILWNNLVTEGVITINLIMDPMEGDEMQRPPISPVEPLLTQIMLKRVILMAATVSIITLGWYIFRLKSNVPLKLARTETFTLLVILEWLNLLNCRSVSKSGLSLSIFKNKWVMGGLIIGNILQILVVYWRPLGDLFNTAPIDFKLVPLLGIIACPILMVEEIRKFFLRKKIVK